MIKVLIKMVIMLINLYAELSVLFYNVNNLDANYLDDYDDYVDAHDGDGNSGIGHWS